MSEQDNVQMVRRAYQAVSQREMGTLMSLLSADVVWALPKMPGVPFAGEWRGRKGVEQFFGSLGQSHEVIELEPERFIAQGDTVVVLGRFVMRVKATGRILRSQWAHVWTVQKGWISSFREYVDTAAVIAAHASAEMA